MATSTANQSVKPVHVIDQALTMIETKGWTQGKAKDTYGRLCVSAACQEAARALQASYPVASEASRIVAETATGTPDPSRLPSWNDARHRTKHDVVNTLRSALSVAFARRR